MPVLNVQGMIANRVEGIRRFHEETKQKRAELDVSGGIDSAVVLGLLAQAVGPENITAVYSGINSSKTSLENARAVANAFNVKLIELDLTSAYEGMVQTIREAMLKAGHDIAEVDARMKSDPTILGSFRSCLRAPVGRFSNRAMGGGIRHGTGNEDEDRWLRFYQKGGDGEVDTNPIAMLSKGEVYQVAVGLGVPRQIIEATPTPDLWGCGAEHNDEDELSRLSGVSWTYSRVDPDTGKYTRIGTIEAMSRFMDNFMLSMRRYMHNFDGPFALVSVAEFVERGMGEDDYLWSRVKDKWEGPARDFGLTLDHILSASRWNKMTAHKANPNIPMCVEYNDDDTSVLNIRNYMLDEDLLTDDLPFDEV
jgi:NAD+ synthetase